MDYEKYTDREIVDATIALVEEVTDDQASGWTDPVYGIQEELVYINGDNIAWVRFHVANHTEVWFDDFGLFDDDLEEVKAPQKLYEMVRKGVDGIPFLESKYQEEAEQERLFKSELNEQFQVW